MMNEPKKNVIQPLTIKGGGDGGGNMSLEVRVAKLESDVHHILTDVTDIKSQLQRLDGKLETQIQCLDGKLETQIQRLDGKLETQIQRLDIKLETQIQRLDIKLETQIQRLDNKMDSNFKWLIGIFLMAFISSFGGLAFMMAHGFNWL
ncbi:MAG: hypothetical protein WBE18_05755 [Gammaproteobacteria bacterium]